jgi:hypothetical protein
MRLGLARLGVNNSRGLHSHVKDLLDLGLGGAVKTCAELGEQAENLRVRVALDSYVELAKITM